MPFSVIYEPKLVVLQPQHHCFKVKFPVTLVVAPQFLTVPNDISAAHLDTLRRRDLHGSQKSYSQIQIE